jgi:hypothetical protein
MLPSSPASHTDNKAQKQDPQNSEEPIKIRHIFDTKSVGYPEHPRDAVDSANVANGGIYPRRDRASDGTVVPPTQALSRVGKPFS